MPSIRDRLGRSGPRRAVAGLLVLLAAALAACAPSAPGLPGGGLAAPSTPAATPRAEVPSAGLPRTPAREFLLDRFGGAYEDARLAAYVGGVGRTVAAVSGAADRSFTFTVLDSGIPNAFAEPPGHIYVTRGLLALMTSEAELAAVLAHEIAHLALGHPAERTARSEAALRLGRDALAAGGDPRLLEEIAATATASLLRYGRDQELEADAFGIRYAALAGYDPFAMAAFVSRMAREEALRAGTAGAGRSGGDFLASHPSGVERIRQAEAVAAMAPAGPARREEERFLAAIDGLPWGDEADFAVEGRTIASRSLGIVLTAPRGWVVRLVDGEVMAMHGTGGAVLLDGHAVPGGTTPAGYLSTSSPLGGSGAVQPLVINGFDAATTAFRAESQRGPVDVRLLAVRVGPTSLARIAFLTPPPATRALDEDLRAFAYSLRRAAPDAIGAESPPRIRILRVGPGETARSLAARMSTDRPLERFLALNGLDDPDAVLPPGTLVKLVLG